MTPAQRQQRMNVRNFMLTHNMKELQWEHEESLKRNDAFRAECVMELMNELKQEQGNGKA